MNKKLFWVARNVEARLNLILTKEDIEDLSQEAAIGFEETKTRDEPVQWQAAKNKAFDYALKNFIKQVDIIEMIDEIIEDEDEDYNPFDFESHREKILILLVELRKKRGNRGLKIAQKEVRILELLLRGASNKEIAKKMNVSSGTIRKLRSNIRKRLS